MHSASRRVAHHCQCPCEFRCDPSTRTIKCSVQNVALKTRSQLVPAKSVETELLSHPDEDETPNDLATGFALALVRTELPNDATSPLRPMKTKHRRTLWISLGMGAGAVILVLAVNIIHLNVFLIFLIPFFLGGGFLVVFGLQQRKTKMLIEATPTSNVSSVSKGFVEVKGSAQPVAELLKSPFSEAECVYYCYKVKKHAGHSWLQIAYEESPDPFYVQDDTGKILVKPAGAEVHLKTDRKYQSSWTGNLGNQPGFARELSKIGLDPKGFLGITKSLRCEETYILPGDDLYVLGTATPSLTDQLVIGKSPEHDFVLSDQSEKQLVYSLERNYYLCTVGGAALVIGCFLYAVKLLFLG